MESKTLHSPLPLTEEMKQKRNDLAIMLSKQTIEEINANINRNLIDYELNLFKNAVVKLLQFQTDHLSKSNDLQKRLADNQKRLNGIFETSKAFYLKKGKKEAELTQDFLIKGFNEKTLSLYKNILADINDIKSRILTLDEYNCNILLPKHTNKPNTQNMIDIKTKSIKSTKTIILSKDSVTVFGARDYEEIQYTFDTVQYPSANDCIERNQIKDVKLINIKNIDFVVSELNQSIIYLYDLRQTIEHQQIIIIPKISAENDFIAADEWLTTDRNNITVKHTIAPIKQSSQGGEVAIVNRLSLIKLQGSHMETIILYIPRTYIANVDQPYNNMITDLFNISLKRDYKPSDSIKYMEYSLNVEVFDYDFSKYDKAPELQPYIDPKHIGKNNQMCYFSTVDSLYHLWDNKTGKGYTLSAEAYENMHKKGNNSSKPKGKDEKHIIIKKK